MWYLGHEDGREWTEEEVRELVDSLDAHERKELATILATSIRLAEAMGMTVELGDFDMVVVFDD